MVELEGIEPSSKHGINMLSTCLVSVGIFVSERRLKRPNARSLSSVRSDHRQEASCSGSRFVSTAPSSCFGKKLLGRCLVAATLAAMKRLIYYSSITQRERSYFRQLKLDQPRLKCRPTTHCMLTNHFCPLSKPVSPFYNL